MTASTTPTSAKAGLLSVNTTLYIQPGRHLKISLVDDYEQLTLSGARLFTANVYDVRLAWYFTSRLFADVIGQGQDVRNNTTLYPPGTAPRTGTLATQWLIGYQINPWTVFYAGSSEGYQETGDGQLQSPAADVFPERELLLSALSAASGSCRARRETAERCPHHLSVQAWYLRRSPDLPDSNSEAAPQQRPRELPRHRSLRAPQPHRRSLSRSSGGAPRALSAGPGNRLAAISRAHALRAGPRFSCWRHGPCRIIE